MNSTCPACKSTNTKDASIRENNGIYGPGAASWVVEEKSICNDCGVYFKPMANEPTIAMMNEAIARFMGYEQREDDYRRPNNTLVFKIGEYWTPIHKLKYHKSWDALMPCWDRFRTVVSDHFNEDYPAEYCSMCDIWALQCEHVNIHGAYKLLYDAIQWHNQQKQKDGQ